MLYLQDGGYPALGASGVWKSLIYALAKNAILWRFCLRRARITGPHNAPRYGERRNRHTRPRHARLRIRLSPLYGINDKDGRYLKIPTVFINGGDKRIRTADLLNANQALSRMGGLRIPKTESSRNA